MSNKLFLRSLNSPYNDETRGSVLSIQDMDNNLIYLKGLTSKTLTFNGEKILLEQLNGSVKEVNISSFNNLNVSGILSATTIQGDGSQLSGIDNFYVTGGTLSNNILYLDRNDILSAITVDLSTLETFDTKVTGVTFDNNLLTISDNSGTTFNILINNLTGLTVNGNISGTTFYGDGSQLENVLNLGSDDLTIPINTNRILNISSGSTFSINDTFKTFETSGNTFLISDNPIADNNLLLNHITLFRENNKVKARFKYDNSTIDEIKFGDVFDFYNADELTPISKSEKIRVKGFIIVSADTLNEETVIELDENQLALFNSPDITDVNGTLRILQTTGTIPFGNLEGLKEDKTLTEIFSGATEDMSTAIFHVVDNKVELLVPTGEIIVGDALQRGRSATVTSALDTLAKQVGDIFINGVDSKLQLGGTPTYIIRFNANGEGEAQKLISGNNKVLVTNNSGVEEEVDLVSFLDLLTATGVTANGVLNTTDLGGTARGVLGSWKITDLVIKNTTANLVHINLGTTPGGSDILNNFSVGANAFIDDIVLLKSLFSETVEQSIYVSSSNWNSANLIIKFSVKKVY